MEDVDVSKFEIDTWENKWYECPNCQFTSIDRGFIFCPACGTELKFPAEEPYYIPDDTKSLLEYRTQASGEEIGEALSKMASNINKLKKQTE